MVMVAPSSGQPSHGLAIRADLYFPQFLERVGSYIFEDSIKSHMQKLNDFITRRVQ